MALHDKVNKATDIAFEAAKAFDPEKVADAVAEVAHGAATATKSIDLDKVKGAMHDAVDSAAEMFDASIGRNEATAHTRHTTVSVTYGDKPSTPAEPVEATAAPATATEPAAEAAPAADAATPDAVPAEAAADSEPETPAE